MIPACYAILMFDDKAERIGGLLDIIAAAITSLVFISAIV